MENNNSLVWENVSLKEPQLSINSTMRDNLHDSIGIDLFRTEIEGKTILSLKSGSQFLFAKKNEKRIVCNDLANYTVSTYNGKSHFKLVLNDWHYIFYPVD